MNDVAIKVDSVSKSFKLPHAKNTSLKSAFVNIFRGKRTYEKQQVLKNVSFEIKKGEFFGIVGRNGSGKSTLLKLLAGIYSPDEGAILVNGKLTPFIELGVGFNPELTGRENVYLNGALLGFSRREMDAMYKDIVEFAELERFMDQKLKNYSSGMQVRLAFSIAIRAETDILLIDEVLAVGDQSFQEKCYKYFSEIKKSNKTVIFVTHDMSSVERFCDRVLLLDKSQTENGIYPVREAVAQYNALNHQRVESGDSEAEVKTKHIAIKKVVLYKNANTRSAYNFMQGDKMTIRISVDCTKDYESVPYIIGLAFHDTEEVNLSGPNSTHIELGAGSQDIEYVIDRVPFNMGEYRLTVGVFDKETTEQFDLLNKQIKFFVNTSTVHYGKFILEGKWKKI